MNDSPIVPILNRVDTHDINQLLEYYVHDYLRSMHRVGHSDKKKEYEVIIIIHVLIAEYQLTILVFCL